MTIYERLNVDEEVINRLDKAGIIRANAKRDLQIYEYYLSEKEKHGSMQAMTNVSERFSLSETHVKRIVYGITKTLIHY